MRTAVGILLVFPGVLLAPNIANDLYLNAGGVQGSIPHYFFVLAMLVGSPWLGMKVLNQT